MIWQFLTFGRKGKLTFITSVTCRLTISNIWIKKRKINSPLHLSPVIWPYPTSGERKWKFTFITSVLSHLAIFNIKRNEREIIFDTTVLCPLSVPTSGGRNGKLHSLHLYSVIWPFPTSGERKGKLTFICPLWSGHFQHLKGKKGNQFFCRFLYICIEQTLQSHANYPILNEESKSPANDC